MLGTIVLAVDSSPQAERAGTLATKLAASTGDEVVVVHVTEVMVARGGTVELDGDRDGIHTAERHVKELEAGGVRARLVLGRAIAGHVAQVIEDDVDLVVVGGPTHAFGMSRPGTRQDAARQAERPLVSAGSGLRDWLETVRGGSPRVAAAAFDTRIDRPRLPGSAARAAERRLRRLGFRIAAQPASFYVTGTPGPLVAGEPERARRWGEELGALVAKGQPARRIL